MKKLMVGLTMAFVGLVNLHADFVANITGTDTVNFPSTPYVLTAGPVPLVSTLGATVVYTSATGNSTLGSGPYGLGQNGTWNQPQAGTDSGSAPITFTFDLPAGKKVLSVGGFINYAPGFGTPTIAVLNASSVVTESYNLLVTHPISTSGTNQGENIGISRSSGDIAAFQISGAFIIIGDLVFTMSNGTFSTDGLNSNQRAVLAPINRGITNGAGPGFNSLVNALAPYGANSAALAGTMNDLSPQKLQILRNVAFDGFGFVATHLDDHTASLRYGQGGFDASGLQVLDSSIPSMLSQIKGRLVAYNPAPAAHGLLSDAADPVLGGVSRVDSKEMQGVVPVTSANRWSAFVSGNVILADVSSNEDVANSHFTTGSVTAGADYRLDNNWAVGTLFGYGHTSATTDANGSKTRVDSYSPGIYATYADHGWFANGLFAYNYNSYNESRVIPFLGHTASGSPTGNQYDANLDGGYEFRSGNWTFGPTAALQYVHLQIDSFTEGGAGAADLAVNEQNADSLRSRLGGEVRYNWSWYGGKVTATPHLSASWQHEYLDNSDGITSQFSGQGLGSFTVNTTSPERNSALVDVGLDTQWNSAFNMFVDYQAQAGQSNFFAQSIEGGVKVGF